MTASPWRREFERRCRRVVGVADDSLPVEVTVKGWCAYDGEEYGADIEIRCGGGLAMYDGGDLADLLHALDTVPDDEALVIARRVASEDAELLRRLPD